MKRYRLRDPSGSWMTTTAPSLARAKSNFAWRLTQWPYGMFLQRAREWARDTEEAPQ